MRWLVKIALTVIVVFEMGFMPVPVYSEVDWEVSSAIQLAETPIDVAQAQGSELTFILTDQAKVLIYSEDDKLLGVIPVDPSVTSIAISPKGEQIHLINSKRKILKTLDISFIVDFNLDNSPFLGPADAKIVVAVFSDFQ